VDEMGSDEKNWGTQKEAAAILGVSISTLTRWLSEGLIEIRKLGQRVSLDDVRRLLELREDEYMREIYKTQRTQRTIK